MDFWRHSRFFYGLLENHGFSPAPKPKQPETPGRFRKLGVFLLGTVKSVGRKGRSRSLSSKDFSFGNKYAWPFRIF